LVHAREVVIVSEAGPSLHVPPSTAGKVLHWAPFYDLAAFLFTLGQEKGLRRETVALAHVSPGQSVLDVGCGTGSLTLAAKEAAGPNGTVAGIDPALEMVSAARRKAARAHLDIDFRPGVIEDLPFADGSFDVVLSSLMLHHLPEEVKHQGLSEVVRVLKPGGVFVAVDMSAASHGIHGHVRSLLGHGSPPRMDNEALALSAAGLEDIHSGRMKLKLLGFVTGRKPSRKREAAG
jgi:ubiquinone/menaquinone biosynthesis C-methylase UbiE